MFGTADPGEARRRTGALWIYLLEVDGDEEHCREIVSYAFSTNDGPVSRDPSRVVTRASANGHGKEARLSLSGNPPVSSQNSSSQLSMTESLALNFRANQYRSFSIAFSISVREIELGLARPAQFT